VLDKEFNWKLINRNDRNDKEITISERKTKAAETEIILEVKRRWTKQRPSCP